MKDSEFTIATFPRRLVNNLSLRRALDQTCFPHRLIGNSDLLISSVASPISATEGSLYFVTDAFLRAEVSHMQLPEGSCLITPREISVSDGIAQVIADEPLGLFLSLLPFVLGWSGKPEDKFNNVLIRDQSGHIAPSVRLGKGSLIGDGVTIGEGTFIGRNCIIHDDVSIGDNVFIQDNVVIGSVGLGYYLSSLGERLFFPHIGSVWIESNVVIGSGSVLVRGQLGDTVLEQSCRLGNLVNISHNVVVKHGAVLSSSVCVAGGAEIGADCKIGVGAMINAKIKVGARSAVGLGSVVTKSLPADSKVFGVPAKSLPTMRDF